MSKKKKTNREEIQELATQYGWKLEHDTSRNNATLTKWVGPRELVMLRVSVAGHGRATLEMPRWRGSIRDVDLLPMNGVKTENGLLHLVTSCLVFLSKTNIRQLCFDCAVARHEGHINKLEQSLRESRESLEQLKQDPPDAEEPPPFDREIADPLLKRAYAKPGDGSGETAIYGRVDWTTIRLVEKALFGDWAAIRKCCQMLDELKEVPNE